MEDKNLPPTKIPSDNSSDALESTDENAPVSSLSSGQKTYPIENLEVRKEGEVVASQELSAPSPLSIPFSKRRAAVVSLIITFIVVMITVAMVSGFIKLNGPDSASSDVPTQDVNFVKQAEEELFPELNSTEGSVLLINGDIVTRGVLKVVSNDFSATLGSQTLDSDQQITFPNASGTICLDANNCNFVTADQLAESIAVVQGQGAGGVESLNGADGDITIQGTANRVSVTTANGVLTLSLPQNLNTSASVQFGNLDVAGTTTIALDCTSFSNNGKLTTTAGGQIVCGNDIGGGGGGVTSPGGTAGRLAVFSDVNEVSDSWLLQNGSTIEVDATRNLSLLGGFLSVTGDLNVSGDGDFDGTLAVGNNGAAPSVISPISVVHDFNGINCTTFGCWGILSNLTATNVTGATPFISTFGSLITISAGSLNQAAGLTVNNPTGAGTLTNNYGVYIASLTKGTNDYGVYVQGADTYGLWVDSGATRLDGTLEVQSLGATNTATYLCRNGSNQLAACNTSGAGAAFLQGGNNFGGTGTLGLTSNNDLNVITQNINRLTITGAGETTFNPTAADADFKILGDSSPFLFHVDAGQGRIGIGRDPGEVGGILGMLHIVQPAGNNNGIILAYDDTCGNCLGSGLEFKYGIGGADGSFRVARIVPQILPGGGGDIFFQTAPDQNEPYVTQMAVQRSGHVGIGTTTADGHLEIAGNMSQAAWGLNGIQLQATSATYTDSSTAGSGTATNAVFNSFGIPTLAATNASVTTTNAATVYIQGAPAAGTNQTITNSYSLWVDDGPVRFDGNLDVRNSTFLGDTGADTLTISGTAVSIPNNLNIDTNTLFIDSTANRVGIGNAAPGAALEVTGDIYLTKEAPRTIKIANSTTAATAGAALSILGANGNGAAGGAVTLQGGSTNSGDGGAVSIVGGAAAGFTTGGNVTISGGTGFAGGHVLISAGQGGFGDGNIYVGNAITSATPETSAILATGGSGTDVVGANLLFSGGQATGNAVGGSIVFQTSDAGVSGTSIQPSTTKAILLANGNFGIGTSTPDARLELAGDKSQAAWGTDGINLQATAATFTDTSTCGGCNANTMVFNSFGASEWDATNSNVNVWTAANVYIAGAPELTGGSDDTLASSYALWVDSTTFGTGHMLLDGNLHFEPAGTTHEIKVLTGPTLNGEDLLIEAGDGGTSLDTTGGDLLLNGGVGNGTGSGGSVILQGGSTGTGTAGGVFVLQPANGGDNPFFVANSQVAANIFDIAQIDTGTRLAKVSLAKSCTNCGSAIDFYNFSTQSWSLHSGEGGALGGDDFFLRLQDGSTNPQVMLFNHSDGSVIFQNKTDSATGFQIQDDGGAPLFIVDTSAAEIEIAANLIPTTADSRDLGTSSLEFNQLFLGDNEGITLGLNDDATLRYDENSGDGAEDRVELTGTGASLWIEDRLSLGAQTFTMVTAGAATENLTPTSSYVEVTGQDNASDLISIQTGSAKEGDILIITNTSATQVSILAEATTKVDSGTDKLLDQFDVISFIYDGTNWLQTSAALNNQ